MMGRSAAYFIADKFANSLVVAERIATIRRMFVALGLFKHWEICLQTEIHENKRAEKLSEQIEISAEVPNADRHYFRAEILDTGLTLAPDGVKVGWAIHDDPFKGGEVPFDDEIHRNFPNISFKYTWPGFRLSGLKEPPYLTRHPEERIMIPVSRVGIPDEILKITVQTNASVVEILERIAENVISGTETYSSFPKIGKRKCGNEVMVTRVRLKIKSALEKLIG